MTGYNLVNLKLLIDVKGEGFAKEFLSTFSCPINPDVENFLRHKSIEFAKQGISQTHLVLSSFQGIPVLIGYFTLANKYIHIRDKAISNTLKRRISKFGTWNPDLKCTILSAPLIAQLGKNFSNGYNNLITGDELLKMACDKVSLVQLDIGGRVAYLECEDKPSLTSFYERNGFVNFGKRTLENDEKSVMAGEYLIQMLRITK